MSLKPPTAHRDKKMARRLGRSKLARYRRRIRERCTARELARHSDRYPMPTRKERVQYRIFLLVVFLRAAAAKVFARVSRAMGYSVTP